MKVRTVTVLAPLVLPAACLFAVYVAIYRPEYLSNYYLGVLIFSQVLLAAVWRFRERFFLLLIVVFLWAGLTIPLQGLWTTGRWVVLAVGAVAGFSAYMRDRDHNFGLGHLIAFFCVLAAVVSAVSSPFPRQALLKAISLLLLFLYASSGARLAIYGMSERFFPWLLTCCECLTYISAAAYLGFHFPLFGSSNSLGAVMGVVVVPLLMWGLVIADQPAVRQRRSISLLLALFLLLFSVARAGIIAGPLTCVVLCVALRRYRLLIHGVAIGAALATLAAAVTYYQADRSDSAASLFIYKGHYQEGILGSRKAPWDQTLSVIHDHPWFGSGFGTSVNREATGDARRFESAPQALREHGNSYLAIMEWVGLLGVVPFAFLLGILAVQSIRVFALLRQSRTALSGAVPVAMIVIAGLLHAVFEDWLFAPGYYLCVFFWAMALSLADFLPRRQRAAVRNVSPLPQFTPGYAAAPAQQ
jgi:O-antigen ligase